MQVFGDKDSFAILYRPHLEWYTGKHTMIHCNIMLKGILLGDPMNMDLLGTCVLHLQNLRNRVIKQEGRFGDPLFDGLSDNEIMELVYKSNQLEEEFNPAFSYLPAQETNELWEKHTFRLAESTDHYDTVVYGQGNGLRFLWQKWEDRRNGLKNLQHVHVDYPTFYSAIQEFLVCMKQTYPDILQWFNPGSLPEFKIDQPENPM